MTSWSILVGQYLNNSTCQCHRRSIVFVQSGQINLADQQQFDMFDDFVLVVHCDLGIDQRPLFW